MNRNWINCSIDATNTQMITTILDRFLVKFCPVPTIISRYESLTMCKSECREGDVEGCTRLLTCCRSLERFSGEDEASGAHQPQVGGEWLVERDDHGHAGGGRERHFEVDKLRPVNLYIYDEIELD